MEVTLKILKNSEKCKLASRAEKTTKEEKEKIFKAKKILIIQMW